MKGPKQKSSRTRKPKVEQLDPGRTRRVSSELERLYWSLSKDGRKSVYTRANWILEDEKREARQREIEPHGATEQHRAAGEDEALDFPLGIVRGVNLVANLIREPCLLRRPLFFIDYCVRGHGANDSLQWLP